MKTIVCSLLIFQFAFISSGVNAASSPEKELRGWMVPVLGPRLTKIKFKPLFDELSERIDILVSISYKEGDETLLTGCISQQVDFFLVTPGPMAKLLEGRCQYKLVAKYDTRLYLHGVKQLSEGDIKSVGVIRSSTSEGVARADMLNKKFVVFDNYKNAFLGLLRKEVDVIASANILNKYAPANISEKLVTIKKYKETGGGELYFSPDFSGSVESVAVVRYFLSNSLISRQLFIEGAGGDDWYSPGGISR